MGKESMNQSLNSQEESDSIDSPKDEVIEESVVADKSSEVEEATQDTEDSSMEDVSEDDEKAKEKKSGVSFFKKNKKDEKIEELNDRLIRKAAEFDNFRKRNEKEKSAMFEVGAKGVVEKILPVIDSFERGLSTVSEEDKDDPFVEGMEKVYKQFLTCLEDIGVGVIEAVGKEFDPDFHNAVMHEEDPDQGNNIIIEEFQKGYTYRDSVVRYSMVKVVN